MSRRVITSIEHLLGTITAHARQARLTGARHLILLHLPTGVTAPIVSSAGNLERAKQSIDAQDKLVSWLGRGRDSLVFSTSAGWRVSELVAALGTVQAGGLAVVVVSSGARHQSALLQRLANCVKAVNNPTLAGSGLPTASACTLAIKLPWHRLLASLDQTKPQSVFRRSPKPPTRHWRRGHRTTKATPAWWQGLAEQDALLGRAQRHLTQVNTRSHKALIVVTGPRGCGKSALLGRLHRHLHQLGHDVIITGPVASATHALCTHAGIRHIAYRPVDVAAAEPAAIMMIDEAASVSSAQLRHLVSHHRHAILATTTDGYEPGGRAFELRTVPALSAGEQTETLKLHASTPMRWHAGDALQSLLDTAFLLSDSPQQAPAETAGQLPSSLKGNSLHRSHLRRDSTTARQLIQLLNATHYQSSLATTDDVLTGRLHTRVIEHNGVVLGAMVTVEEPALSSDVHAAVLANTRRLHDRLLPQLLARCANSATPLSFPFTRVVRIAVRDDVRRQGLGRRLIASLLDAQSPHDTDCVRSIGAVFAADPKAIAFWDSLGFTRFHLGQRINPRSGARSAAVLRSDQPEVRQALHKARALFSDNQAPQLQAHDPAEDLALLRLLAEGARGLAETRAAVHRMWHSMQAKSMDTIRDWPSVPGYAAANTDRQRERAVIEWVRANVDHYKP